MIIEPDVAAVANHFGMDAKLIQAVVEAEGGGPHIVTAVQCSIPASDAFWAERPDVPARTKALEVVCRSAVHAMSDWIKANDAGDGVPLQQQFVEFWAKRWAPIGVANDPRHLNQFWSLNVLSGWTKA